VKRSVALFPGREREIDPLLGLKKKKKLSTFGPRGRKGGMIVP